MANKSDVDVLIIGAGISGIYTAKCYLDLHPNSRLIILDKDNCVGGTWNSRRGYDTFWTQWTVGTAEFSDQAMVRPPDEDIYLEFFKAKHTTKYLESYVDSHSYAGQTLRDRIRLSTEVLSLSKANGKWTVEAKASSLEHAFTSPKLIVASGLTSIPHMPPLLGRESFQGQLLHHEDFGSSKVLTSQDLQKITILGAGKSSADMAYEAVKAGKKVSWILKATDTTGPGFFLSPKGIGPYKNAFEIGMTRVAGTFTPSFMNGMNWWTRLLHSSKFGVKLMSSFWGTVDADARSDANFESRENLQGFKALAPHSPIFWQNCTGGLLNHADFFDTIAKNVHIYCADVQGVDEDHLLLKSGERIPSDVILCGTGWVPSLQFFSETQRGELGLPHLLSQESVSEKARWAQLEAEADNNVLATFPQLAKPPPHYHKAPTHTPYRLYRHIVPISASDNEIQDRSIVFIGHVGVGNYFPTVECQALWAVVYLDGKLALPNMEDQEKEVALFTAWCRRRYLSSGEDGNNMTFELMGYVDTLLRDLGLSSYRKGWFKDLFSPTWASDFKGLVAECKTRFGYNETGRSTT